MSSTENDSTPLDKELGDVQGDEKSVDVDGEITLDVLLKEKKKTVDGEEIDLVRQETSRQILRERETRRIGQQKYFQLRDKWSWFIFGYISFMLLFQLFLTLAIGFKWANFSQYRTFLNVVIGQNFAQIVGMGVIVAKYLFPNNKHLE